MNFVLLAEFRQLFASIEIQKKNLYISMVARRKYNVLHSLTVPSESVKIEKIFDKKPAYLQNKLKS